MNAGPHGAFGFDPGIGFALLFCGGPVLAIAAVTTIIVALWQRATPRAIVTMHFVALAAMTAVALVTLK